MGTVGLSRVYDHEPKPLGKATSSSVYGHAVSVTKTSTSTAG